ncbi:ead/Ea22-like family protein [Serratia marcescens]|uniref:ead/Ea22-like family protein n=1 Tax=Serratia marcescens TaxID=615 RepID=UPI0018D8C4B4|nr:ead/Ea22-like family protein [Serratia marcescens]MBH2746396.1 ead/Ea22-like family protein [Serratia marcescens]MBH2967533.1 ead/Ea22-like family protein [Serratia marcescens]MBN6134477.1 ead/Ea22-like family protein [Serratia marcescens]UYU03042.1 ead/Ea22-like family protein [Serratia marcescens]
MDKFSELKAVAEKAKELAGINNYKKGKDAIAAFKAAANPAAILALLAELEAKDKRIDELKERLATPVRLSQRYETAGYCIDEHYCQKAADGDYLDRDELISSLREQGFTVEGDE